MSDTPRTDAVWDRIRPDMDYPGEADDLVDLCRSLERSLAQARAEAIEEAARVAETCDGIAPFMADGRNVVATAIRALMKGK